MSSIIKGSIYPKDLRGYPRLVRETVMDAVINHDVGYRIMDGNHIRLYCGDRDITPFKVSRARPVEHTMVFLEGWLAENIPTWADREVPTTVVSVEEEVSVETSQPESEPESDPAVESEAPAQTEVLTEEVQGEVEEEAEEEEWESCGFGFETNGSIFRCTHEGCTHIQDSSNGLWFHEDVHTGKVAARSARAAQTRRARVAREREARRAAKVREAVRGALAVLAEQHGLYVTDAPGDEIEALRERVEKAEAERDEALTRLKMIEEALAV